MGAVFSNAPNVDLLRHDDTVKILKSHSRLEEIKINQIRAYQFAEKEETPNRNSMNSNYDDVNLDDEIGQVQEIYRDIKLSVCREPTSK